MTVVAASASNVTLVGTNSTRKGLVVANNSSATLYCAFNAATAKLARAIVLPAGTFWTCPVPNFTGAFYGAWDYAEGSATITEV